MARLIEQAVCIRYLDWSQTSQIVVLLTEHHGKLRGLAKGSKRLSPSSVQKFSGGIELLTVGQVVASVRPSRELATITEWDLLDDCLHLRKDLHRQRLALYAADLVNALLLDGDPHVHTFNAMRHLLEALRDRDPDAELARFQWALLCDVGYRPQLERDVHGDAPLPAAATYTFDPRAGGLTTRRGVGDWRVRRATVELMRQGIWDTADAETLRRANRLMCSYVRAMIDRELPTMRYVLGLSH